MASRKTGEFGDSLAEDVIMNLSQKVRAAARILVGPKAAGYIRGYFRESFPALNEYRSYLRGKHGLEIGGPSGILAVDGPLPVYDVLESLDNCLYSARTIWTGDVQGGFHYHPQKAPGKQIICEASCLEPIMDSSYACLLASHCLEHVANPFLALSEWRRVLADDALLLLLLPHKDGTFDWRRPPSTLAHMIADYTNQIGEDDLTHLPEILALHDLEKDVAAGTKEQFRQRCTENQIHRAMHHHVFDTLTALQTVDHAGFKIIRVDNLRPYHIVILARRSAGPVDNGRFLRKGSEHWSRSPFPSDRAHV